MTRRLLQTASARFVLFTLLMVMTGTAQAMPLSTRDDQRDPVAGKILAIILGTTVSSIAVMFGLFCLWLWRRIKKQKKLEEEEAARAVQEGRTSNADTVIEGTDNELQTVGSTDQVKETGTDKGVTHTTQTAIA